MRKILFAALVVSVLGSACRAYEKPATQIKGSTSEERVEAVAHAINDDRDFGKVLFVARTAVFEQESGTSVGYLVFIRITFRDWSLVTGSMRTDSPAELEAAAKQYTTMQAGLAEMLRLTTEQVAAEDPAVMSLELIVHFPSSGIMKFLVPIARLRSVAPDAKPADWLSVLAQYGTPMVTVEKDVWDVVYQAYLEAQPTPSPPPDASPSARAGSSSFGS